MTMIWVNDMNLGGTAFRHFVKWEERKGWKNYETLSSPQREEEIQMKITRCFGTWSLAYISKRWCISQESPIKSQKAALAVCNRHTALGKCSFTNPPFLYLQTWPMMVWSFQMSQGHGKKGFISKTPWAELNSTPKTCFLRMTSQGVDLATDSILLKIMFLREVDLVPSQEC